jgi:5-methylcytosine-specific restriction endonuclease McrA
MFKHGKVTKEWLAIRGQWVLANPPNHEGYYLCGICRRPVYYLEMQLDHIDGREGTNLSNWDNLQPTHGLCNFDKGSKRGISNVSIAEYEFRRLLDL